MRISDWSSDVCSSDLPGLVFRISCVTTLVGGTMFLMWLGERITSRGIGNGLPLIIMAGIVAHLPTAIISLFAHGRTVAVSQLIRIGTRVVALGLTTFISLLAPLERASGGETGVTR